MSLEKAVAELSNDGRNFTKFKGSRQFYDAGKKETAAYNLSFFAMLTNE